jgi:NADPH:quinone reductase-like Zn-dependent oxidoreductase
VRALTIDAHGELDQVTYREDLPVPELGAPDDVRVRVSAAALNHLDLFASRPDGYSDPTAPASLTPSAPR